MPGTPKYVTQDSPAVAAASFAGIVATRLPIPKEGPTQPPVLPLALGEARDPRPGSTPLDPCERERILLESMDSVRYIAQRIHSRLPHHVELEDLISAGVIGLMDAFNKFDHTRNTQFKTYAEFRIRGAILDTLRSRDWSPRDLRRKGRSVQQAIQTLSQILSRKPTEQEIAGHLQVSLADFQKLVGDLRGLEISSLSAQLSPDSDENELAQIPASPDESPLLRCLQGEKKQHVTEAVEALPERERLVLSLYYYEELTMREVGLIIGASESRVSEIHTSAIVHLRACLETFRQPTRQSPAKSPGVANPRVVRNSLAIGVEANSPVLRGSLSLEGAL